MVRPFNQLMSVEEQKEFERQRIEEARRLLANKRGETLDTQSTPAVLLAPPPDLVGAPVAGQVVDVSKYKYDRVKVRGPDGVARYSAGNKDAIAKSLMGFSKKELLVVAEANGLDLSKHFKQRNSGHFRMIVGQALRSIIKKKGTVWVRYAEINSLSQKVGWPEGYSEEPKGTTLHPIRRTKA